MLMKTRFEPIDFNLVEPHHEHLHKRMLDWARWLHGEGRWDDMCTPMFKLYKPDNWDREPHAATPVDGTDAQRIHKGVQALPSQHRISVNWFYVSPVKPERTCRIIGTSIEGLMHTVRNARQMLINRKV